MVPATKYRQTVEALPADYPNLVAGTFLGMREEMVVQRPRRMDHDAGQQSAIEFPKMHAISCDKGIAFERYRGGENKPILLWKAVDFGPSGRRSNR